MKIKLLLTFLSVFSVCTLSKAYAEMRILQTTFSSAPSSLPYTLIQESNPPRTLKLFERARFNYDYFKSFDQGLGAFFIEPKLPHLFMSTLYLDPCRLGSGVYLEHKLFVVESYVTWKLDNIQAVEVAAVVFFRPKLF